MAKRKVKLELEQVVGLTTKKLIHALEHDKIPVRTLPVLLGITLDKLDRENERARRKK